MSLSLLPLLHGIEVEATAPVSKPFHPRSGIVIDAYNARSEVEAIAHSPLPWQYGRVDSHAFNIRAGESSVALVYAHQGSPTLMDRSGEGEANAALIVQAVNSHQALVDALREFLASGVEHDDPRINYVTMQVDKGAIEQARAALKLAGGK